jgi:hypothetical protein
LASASEDGTVATVGRDEGGWRATIRDGAAEALNCTSIDEVSGGHRTWHRVVSRPRRGTGLASWSRSADNSVLLYDGAGIAARMGHDRSWAQAARSVTNALVDAASPYTPQPPKSREQTLLEQARSLEKAV